MKTTLEIPESLLERAEIAAGCQGIPLGDLVTDAISEKLRRQGQPAPITSKPWLKSFGKLRDLHEETLEIDRIIAETFGTLEREDQP